MTPAVASGIIPIESFARLGSLFDVNSTRSKAATILSLFLFAIPLFSISADWPRWRGPDNNGHSKEHLDSLPQSPKTLWKQELGTGFSSPVVASGKVVMLDAANDREVVRVFSVSDGEELWRADLDEAFGDQQGPEGPRNTAVIDGNRVYAVSCRGELKCLSLDDGQLIWRVNFVDDLGADFIGEKGTAQGAVRHGNDAAPLIDGPHLIAPVGGMNGHSVVCFDKLKGEVVWHSQNDVAGYGSPVVAEIAGVKQVVVFTVEGTIGLRRDNGELLWRVPMETAYGRHVMTPVVHRNTVVVGSHTAGLTGIKVTESGGDFSVENQWVNKDAAPNFSHPVAHGKFLYGLGPNKMIVCTDIETGELRWSQSGNIITSASKAYSGLINANGNILQLTDAGELILFRADPNEYEPLSRVQVVGVNWCNPALSDGVLYVRDGTRKAGTLYAIRLK